MIIEMFVFPLKYIKFLISGRAGKISVKYAPVGSLLPGTALNAMVCSKGLFAVKMNKEGY